MTDRELMQQALEALENVYGKGKRCEAAITALRARLAQPEQPVECMCGICKLSPRQWQGLTDEDLDIRALWDVLAGMKNADGSIVVQFARAIEAKLKEKNT